MSAPVRVKVCGITNAADALDAVEVGADAVGFNFFRGSPRYVAPDVVRDVVRNLPPSVCTVGVFVDTPREQVAAIAAAIGLTALQFHGHESPEFCSGWPATVIKAIRVRDHDAADAARAYDVDFILADAYVEGQLGGTGRRIDGALLQGFAPGRLILAGGLTPENVAAAVRTVRPFGVDVASGVERAPGKKDRNLMRMFIDHAHAA